MSSAAAMGMVDVAGLFDGARLPPDTPVRQLGESERHLSSTGAFPAKKPRFAPKVSNQIELAVSASKQLQPTPQSRFQLLLSRETPYDKLSTTSQVFITRHCFFAAWRWPFALIGLSPKAARASSGLSVPQIPRSRIVGRQVQRGKRRGP